MNSVSCPFGEDYCRSKNNKEECKNGAFFYRCADLDSTKFYKKALEKALQYDLTASNLSVCGQSGIFIRIARKKRTAESVRGMQRKDTEAFECRCQYLRANGKCLQQNAKGTWAEGSEYGILYYQLPVSDGYNGKVDLVLKTKGADELFMTEYKPDRKKRRKKLLRMICEIVTYCKTVKEGAIGFFGGKRGKWSGEKLNLQEENIHPAIMFREGSPQHQEWQNRAAEIDLLLEKHGISVFIVKGETIYRLHK